MYKNDSFSLAESFHRVAIDIIPDDWLENDKDDWHWFVPSVVNMSFACELYLKSLLSDGRSPERRHDLMQLFQSLDESIKERIINNPSFRGDDAFYEKLEEAKLLFRDWRYCFEDDKHPSVDIIFLENFASVLHDIAETEVLP